VSVSSLTNNSVALLSSLTQLASTAASATQGKTRLSAENATQLLQSLTQLAGTLQKLQSSFGQKDGFASGPNTPMGGGQGMPSPLGAGGAGGVGGPQTGQSNPIQQLGAILNALAALQNVKQGAPGAQAPIQGQSQPQGAKTNLPLGDAAGLLSNLKQEQGALLGKIAEGVSKGNITQQELGQLMQGVQQLAQATKAASSDGQISLGEAAQLSQMSMNNALNTKSAFENNTKSSFASFNPVAQTQAQQLGAISQGVKQGSISNGELGKLAEGQGALASAASRVSSPADAARLMGAQQLLGLEVQLARMGHVNG